MGKRVWSRQRELSGLSSTPAEEPLFVEVRPAADQVTGWRIRTGNWPVQILTEKYHIGQVVSGCGWRSAGPIYGAA
jgi:hypothetical protein